MVGPTARVIRLADGRRLAFAEFGADSGRTLLYFHGFPGSRLEGGLTAAAAARLGWRVIAPDRPGFGLSDHQPARTILDWPIDVIALADALGVDRFAVLGVSGGAPYAAACAARLPTRVTAAGFVGGLAPLDRPGATAGMSPVNRLILFLYRRTPGIGYALYRLLAAVVRRRPEWTFSLLTSGLPAPDRAALHGAARQILVRSFGESLRPGYRGGDRELLLFSRPWGFDLREIRVASCLWHGGRDVTVPMAMGRHLAQEIPGCRAVFLPQEGHFSLPINRAEEILATLADDPTMRS